MKKVIIFFSLLIVSCGTLSTHRAKHFAHFLAHTVEKLHQKLHLSDSEHGEDLALHSSHSSSSVRDITIKNNYGQTI